MRRALFAACLLFSAPAFADDDGLRKSAETAFHAHDYATALARYREAYAQSKDPALLYNLARCHHELGDFAAAYEMYTRFAVEAPVSLRTKVPHLDEKIAFVAARTAVVKVAVNVTGATVSIAGKDVGESGTLGPVRVNAGSVTVVARKSGYVDATKTIEAQGGSTVVVDLVLEAKTGVLRVQTNVEATITVDDKVAGRAPVELVVSSGPHRVVAIADGRETWSDTVLVPAGGTRTQTVTLAEKSGSRWWIWAGAGVVVASGIVLTWALVTDKKADHGSFQPGQVAAGLVRF